MSKTIYTRTISAFAKKFRMLLGRFMPSVMNYTM